MDFDDAYRLAVKLQADNDFWEKMITFIFRLWENFEVITSIFYFKGKANGLFFLHGL